MFNDATNEVISIFGRNFLYLPKTLVKQDYILGEDVLLQFNSAITITMLIENFEGYSGQGDIFSKFGLTIDDRLTLQVQQNNFDSTVGVKPQIGDIVYYPVSKQIFKVNFVELDDSFYQFLDENMSYKIQCTLYKYSHETLNTGVTDIDNLGLETDSNTQDEIDQLSTKANEIIDFDTTYFNQT